MTEVVCIHPWTGLVDYRYDTLDDRGIERVLQASADAAPLWAGLTLDARAVHLRAIAAVLRRRKDEIASLMTRDMGKLKRECLGEIEKSASTCEYYAEHAIRYIGDQVIHTEAKRSLVCYQPIGTVFAIMPWNFPIWQVMRFLAPGLMSGNVAVLKHATNVPRCADVLKSVLDDAGVPAGVFGVLHIDNQQAARVIADPRVKAVSLTGSERAGRSVAAVAGQHLKKCVLELGGSDPFVVLADADLDLAVRIAISSRFGNAGQTCIAAKRFIVVPEIADAFTERFVAAASSLPIGDPELDATGLAPMARANLRQELHQQVQDSVAAGARVLIGGVPETKPTCYPATILDQVHPGTRAYQEELFGPVASILRAHDEDDAIRIANDTPFGLGASVWTNDRARGEAVARRIDAGAVFVNALVRSDARLPFGGSKTSGYGRELAEHGMREFTNIKTLYID
ncbi:succinate-semialdehyde dehydrogenase [Ahniella affigens]|uniref:Succinate-semialdehyde dehydrogenase n=1 Tax=Ahniella affigens TaxID=2021234 RepID=A0A2P1PNQ8_9GAMM|nr:NAD-dependent succinate-semialdehyde dehydrogenase [Ahniella affigens]AVP96456.1 succinate-semialdehyde dehydrogenase [Ahniella affigens]